jgi:hypothetical protein
VAKIEKKFDKETLSKNPPKKEKKKPGQIFLYPTQNVLYLVIITKIIKNHHGINY